MKTIYLSKLILIGLILLTYSVLGQERASADRKINQEQLSEEAVMKTFLIEREILNAGELTPEELKGISQKSNAVLEDMGDGIEWLHSYVTENKVYCVYKAENEVMLREHAEKGGFPINKVSTLSTRISPRTAKD